MEKRKERPMKTKPFGIYRYSLHKTEHDGIWERIAWYDDMGAAMQSLRDRTKRPKAMRYYTYTILPVESPSRKIQIKEEQREAFLKAAR